MGRGNLRNLPALQKNRNTKLPLSPAPNKIPDTRYQETGLAPPVASPRSCCRSGSCSSCPGEPAAPASMRCREGDGWHVSGAESGGWGDMRAHMLHTPAAPATGGSRHESGPGPAARRRGSADRCKQAVAAARTGPVPAAVAVECKTTRRTGSRPPPTPAFPHLDEPVQPLVELQLQSLPPRLRPAGGSSTSGSSRDAAVLIIAAAVLLLPLPAAAAPRAPPARDLPRPHHVTNGVEGRHHDQHAHQEPQHQEGHRKVLRPGAAGGWGWGIVGGARVLRMACACAKSQVPGRVCSAWAPGRCFRR